MGKVKLPQVVEHFGSMTDYQGVDMQDTSTLAIQGYTPYAQIPKWIIRSGDSLSHGAVRLYGAIMSYADNESMSAFPGRDRLAEDMGSNPRSVSRCIKELEDFGALIVTRRRNKRTGNFYSNHYVLVFTEPGAENDTRRHDKSDPITKPTMLTRPTSLKESSTPDRSDKLARPISNSTRSVGGLNEKQRKLLRGRLMAVGQLLKDGHKFHDDAAQDAWQDFAYALEDMLGDAYADGYADLIDNGKWTVSAKVASPYVAGAELNKLINTAAQ